MGRGVPQNVATAHLWHNIAGANGPAIAAEARDEPANSMTPADMSKASRRARLCKQSNHEDHD